MAPYSIQAGDQIALFAGLDVLINVPMVIRRHGERYRLIAQAYVHGIMYGEALKCSPWQTNQLQDIVLI
jgi:hypothetical protein